MIGEVAQNWDIERMAVIDRNVLRLATASSSCICEDIPPKVSINEAIELGKRFSTQNSGGFINGILDRIKDRFAPERRDRRRQSRPKAPEARGLHGPPRPPQVSGSDAHARPKLSDQHLRRCSAAGARSTRVMLEDLEERCSTARTSVQAATEIVRGAGAAPPRAASCQGREGRARGAAGQPDGSTCSLDQETGEPGLPAGGRADFVLLVVGRQRLRQDDLDREARAPLPRAAASRVLLGACDTFRAAASPTSCEVWAGRSGRRDRPAGRGRGPRGGRLRRGRRRRRRRWDTTSSSSTPRGACTRRRTSWRSWRKVQRVVVEAPPRSPPRGAGSSWTARTARTPSSRRKRVHAPRSRSRGSIDRQAGRHGQGAARCSGSSSALGAPDPLHRHGRVPGAARGLRPRGVRRRGPAVGRDAVPTILAAARVPYAHGLRPTALALLPAAARGGASRCPVPGGPVAGLDPYPHLSGAGWAGADLALPAAILSRRDATPAAGDRARPERPRCSCRSPRCALGLLARDGAARRTRSSADRSAGSSWSALVRAARSRRSALEEPRAGRRSWPGASSCDLDRPSRSAPWPSRSGPWPAPSATPAPCPRPPCRGR